MSPIKSDLDDDELVIINELRPMLQHFNEELGQYNNREERFKLGQVLTVIDAAISDPDQRKAVKDLINNQWWGGARNAEGPMVNPHHDLRALCEALGFELYPERSTTLPDPYEDLSYAKKRYTNVAKTKE